MDSTWNPPGIQVASRWIRSEEKNTVKSSGLTFDYQKFVKSVRPYSHTTLIFDSMKFKCIEYLYTKSIYKLYGMMMVALRHITSHHGRSFSCCEGYRP
jgi:hypothetical protein